MARSTRGQKRATEKFRVYLKDPANRNRIVKWSKTRSTEDLEHLLKNAPFHGQFQDRNDAAAFVGAALGIFNDNACPIRSDLLQFKSVLPRKKRISATHQEKRTLIHEYRLKHRPVSVSELINSAPSFESAKERVKEIFGADLILRERKVARKDASKFSEYATHNYTQNHPLAEVRLHQTPTDAIICSEEEGFHLVRPDQSAVFVSEHPAPGTESKKYEVELVVIRQVMADRGFSPQLTQWMKEVVVEASANRRNVRPNHPGKMTQIGLNMGAWDKPILGWAKSFTKDMSEEDMSTQDDKVIGMMTLLWGLACAHLPRDIIDYIQDLLELAGYPRMATRNVSEGSGFTLVIDGIKYRFPHIGRAPPEGIINFGYEGPSHFDPVLIKWSVALTIGRDVPANCPLPDSMGSSLADLGLKVVIQGAAGTLTAFQPSHLHGTTQGCGIVGYGISLNSTKRVGDALLELRKRGQTWNDYFKDRVEGGLSTEEYQFKRRMTTE